VGWLAGLWELAAQVSPAGWRRGPRRLHPYLGPLYLLRQTLKYLTEARLFAYAIIYIEVQFVTHMHALEKHHNN
jgi:hypothetical protein